MIQCSDVPFFSIFRFLSWNLEINMVWIFTRRWDLLSISNFFSGEVKLRLPAFIHNKSRFQLLYFQNPFILKNWNINQSNVSKCPMSFYKRKFNDWSPDNKITNRYLKINSLHFKEAHYIICINFRHLFNFFAKRAETRYWY